jgi:hypothetical protein
MEYVIGASIISTLGYDIVYNNILKTMMRTTDSIFNLITNIHSINYNEEIKSLDLEFYIQTISLTIQYLISLVNDENKININNQVEDKVVNQVSKNLNNYTINTNHLYIQNIINDSPSELITENYNKNYDINNYNNYNNNLYKFNQQKQFLIKNTINNIQDNLNVIETNLKYINETIKYNNKLWFPFLFSKSIDRNVERIKYEKKILDSRINLFLKIMIV